MGLFVFFLEKMDLWVLASTLSSIQYWQAGIELIEDPRWESMIVPKLNWTCLSSLPSFAFLSRATEREREREG